MKVEFSTVVGTQTGRYNGRYNGEPATLDYVCIHHLAMQHVMRFLIQEPDPTFHPHSLDLLTKFDAPGFSLLIECLDALVVFLPICNHQFTLRHIRRRHT